MIIASRTRLSQRFTTECRSFSKPRQFTPWLESETGLEVLKPAPKEYLQRWPVSKRVNSSKAEKQDETLTSLPLK